MPVRSEISTSVRFIFGRNVLERSGLNLFHVPSFIFSPFKLTFYTENPDLHFRLADISYTVILREDLGVHIGIYQPCPFYNNPSKNKAHTCGNHGLQHDGRRLDLGC